MTMQGALRAPALRGMASAANLAEVKRTIAREPVYQSRPRYCLLVFGPEAETRVWLVQDGDALYVDRNGNGDLTEPGKKVPAAKSDGAEAGRYTFEVGDVREGTRLHKALTVLVSKLDRLANKIEQVQAFLARHPEARGYCISAEMEMPGWKGTGVGGRVRQQAFYLDVNGVFQFADRPEDAPVVWFGGPWQLTLFGAQRLTSGRDTDVVLGVGTPGVGPGTTVWVDYQGVIPEGVCPTLDIAYPPQRPGEPRVRQRYQLKGRC